MSSRLNGTLVKQYSNTSIHQYGNIAIYIYSNTDSNIDMNVYG